MIILTCFLEIISPGKRADCLTIISSERHVAVIVICLTPTVLWVGL